MIFVYFSCKKDAEILQLSVASLRAAALQAGAPRPEIWVANDAADLIPGEQLPAGVQELRTNYERGGTGKGLDAVRGELAVFRIIFDATGADYLVKVDSDIFVQGWWQGIEPAHRAGAQVPADFLAFEGARALLPMGGVYRLSRWAAKWLAEYFDRRQRWQPGVYAEALTMWHALALSRMCLQLVPAEAGVLGGFSLAATCAEPFLHCGEPHAEGETIVRASRELTRTRMLLLRQILSKN